MTDLKPFTIAILVSLAYPGAQAAEPLEEWEMTSKMVGGPMAMPAQTMIVCQKKTNTGAPPAQSNCKYTKLGKSGNRGTFTMECSGQYPTTITGEGSQTADTMEGTMTILSGGTEIKQSYSGKRLGSCAKEGARNVGGPALPGAGAAAGAGAEMPATMERRHRPVRADRRDATPSAHAATSGAAPASPPPSTPPAAAADVSPAPAAADDNPPKKEGIKDAASKAADSAKNALKSLFSH